MLDHDSGATQTAAGVAHTMLVGRLCGTHLLWIVLEWQYGIKWTGVAVPLTPQLGWKIGKHRLSMTL
jgi:hypothetical protein